MLDLKRKSELHMLETHGKSEEALKDWPREASQTQIIWSKWIPSPCCKSTFNREKNHMLETIKIPFQIIKKPYVCQEPR